MKYSVKTCYTSLIGTFALFQASYTEYGQTKTHILKPNGENLPVTNDNKKGKVEVH